MTTERRGMERVRGPFDATWSGTSGHRTVRITDISETGCFIEDLATPAVSERVEIVVALPSDPALRLAGRVVYLYPSQGFAVRFDEDAPRDAALRDALDHLRR